MAFQAGGAHALDRALESIAYAYAEMTRVPATAIWEKPGRDAPIRMEKTFTVVPARCRAGDRLQHLPDLELLARPVRLARHRQRRSWSSRTRARCCRSPSRSRSPRRCWPRRASTPTWSRWPPRTRPTGSLRCSPCDPRSSWSTSPASQRLRRTGSRSTPRQATVFTEKSGVNAVVIDSTDSFKSMCFNLGFSLALYTGQMCTTPQNLFIPSRRHRDRRRATSPSPTLPRASTAALAKLLGDDARAVELLGGVVNDGVLERLDVGRVGRRGARRVARGRAPGLRRRRRAHPGAGRRSTRRRRRRYEQECFGPVSFLIETSGTAASIDAVPADRASSMAR